MTEIYLMPEPHPGEEPPTGVKPTVEADRVQLHDWGVEVFRDSGDHELYPWHRIEHVEMEPVERAPMVDWD